MVEIEAPGSLYTMKIAFDAVRGASYTSDIAIDDVVVNQGPCQGTKFLFLYNNDIDLKFNSACSK